MRSSAIRSVVTVTDARSMRRLPDKQKGLGTVEYAMAGALITAASVAAFHALGVQIGGLIVFLSNAFS